MIHRNSKTGWSTLGQSLGLGAIALFAFHAISTLLFAVLGLAPSSPNWPFVLILAGALAIAGAAAGLQTFMLSPRLHRLMGIASGTASGVILGFFTIGQLSGKQAQWAIGGAIAGGVFLGALAGWADGRAGRRFWGRAIASISIVCAYGAAFGLGSWGIAAVSTGRWGLAILLGLLTGLYLWLTKRSLGWIHR